MSRAVEALVITGRGNNSPDGVSVVRAAIVHLFASLRRRGVIQDVSEHTPGSFVVTFAKINAVRNAPQRSRNPHELVPRDPVQLAALEPETRALLRRLWRSARSRSSESSRRRTSSSRRWWRSSPQRRRVYPKVSDREQRLRDVLRAALHEYDDR